MCRGEVGSGGFKGEHTFDVPLDDLKQAARVACGTLNDAFLAGIAGCADARHGNHSKMWLGG